MQVSEFLEQINFKESLKSPPVLVGGGVVILSIFFLTKRQLKKKKAVEKNYRKDVVYLHQFPSSPICPSLSPYCLKLETYLKMAKIPYENVKTMQMSPKGKMPWIIYNGETMADSQFCMEYLQKQLGESADMNKHLSKSEVAISRGFQSIIEDNFFIILASWRFCHWEPYFIEFLIAGYGIPRLVMHMIARKHKKKYFDMGLLRHSTEEQIQIGISKLRTISDFLGDKKFLMGSEPCEVDATVFGMLAQVVWQMPETPFEKAVKEDMTNIVRYCETMKETFYPDWDQLCTGSWTKYTTEKFTSDQSALSWGLKQGLGKST